MAAPIDPRRAAFASVALRPEPALSPPDTDESDPKPPVEPVLRGVGCPPPPKPAPLPPAAPKSDLPTDPPAPTPNPPSTTSRQPGPRRDARNSRSGGAAAKDAERRYIGTRRGNLVYLQTQITPALSDRLDQLADEEDVVLGEVLMRCVRAFRPDSPAVRPRRRRRSGNQVRRDIGVLPSEAAEVLDAMNAARLTVSALLRQALERYLG